MIFYKLALAFVMTLGRMLWAGEVQFQTTSVEVDVSSKEAPENLRFEYPFTYTGEGHLSIQKVDVACGCTEVSSDKPNYSKGESGVITANFAPGGRVGIQKKDIYIYFIGIDQPVQLTFVAKLKPGPSLTSKFIYWRIGDEGIEKSVRLNIPEGMTSTITKIDNSDSWYSARIGEWDSTTREYVIYATPLATNVAQKSIMYINLSTGEKLHVYIRVVQKKP